MAQPKKSKKKKKTQNVMTTPPVAAVAPTQTSNIEANPPQPATPGHEWDLVAKGAASTARPASPEVAIMEPEPVKVDAGLQQAQADLDKLQAIVEASLVCLLEHRLEYPLSRFGLLDAFVPAHRIEVLTGAVTLSSILLSGLHFMRVYGLPGNLRALLQGSVTSPI